MKALRLIAPGVTEIQEIERPLASDDDVIIKIEAAGICGGDVHFYKAEMNPPFYPMTFGHEFAGVISEVGNNVKKWKVGDRVVSDNTGYVCGVCPACIRGDFVHCIDRGILGCNMDGGFAEYVKIPGEILKIHPNCLYRIPEKMTFQEATVLEPAANSFKAVIQEGNFLAGENIVIAGPGVLGMLGIQMARIAGAAKIIVVGTERTRDRRESIAKKYGATHWVSSDKEGYADLIKEIAGSNGVSSMIDYVSHPSLFYNALKYIRNCGTIVRVGRNTNSVDFPIQDLTDHALRLQGHQGYDTTSWKSCLSLYEQGLVDLKGMITSEWSLLEYQSAFKSILERKELKVILKP